MVLTLGVAIHRRSACLVGTEAHGRRFSLAFERQETRSPGVSAAESLASLLKSVPAEYLNAPLKVALSAADLACADAWLPPAGIRESSLSKLGPALVEIRCLGEAHETLALDIAPREGAIEAVALSRADLGAILKAAEGFNLVLLTSLPSVLSLACGTVAYTQGGERIECSRRDGRVSWRSFPVDGPDESGMLSCQGIEVPLSQAAALASAVADLDQIPNVLSATPEAKRSWIRRLRDPIVNVAAALALCLGATGFHFHREIQREGIQLEGIRIAEKDLWRRCLPAQEPRQGAFFRAVSERLAEAGDASDGVRSPSALAFWEEIGKQFPDANALGLTLESLDLAPDGGSPQERRASRRTAQPGAGLIRPRGLRSERRRSSRPAQNGLQAMKSARIVLALCVLGILGAGLFAADRYAKARVIRQDRENAEGELGRALGLVSGHPALFGPHGTRSDPGSLKALAQESATRRGVTIGYLSENEREADKGRRERQVIIRIANAPHSSLVLFLRELEGGGTGAWIKELHVRPSREIADAYEETEVVLSKLVTTQGEKKP
jgi:hypothetical protein